MKHEESYRSHELHLHGYFADPDLKRLAELWLRTDTLEYWRYARTLGVIDPLLECHPNTRWLTVGDGHWGRDAHYIIDRGSHALATDISGSFLEEGKRRQYIPDYEVQNAEHLTFADESFDFVLCKEAYHHFPRPTIAVYEMLRVARTAVVLIEPQDEYPARPLAWLKMVVKRLTGRAVLPGYHWFEPAGNYVYTISRRELTKLALGVGLPYLAFRGVNSYYVEGLERKRLPEARAAYWKLMAMIRIQDLLTAVGAVQAGLMVAILFKKSPVSQLMHRLRADHYTLQPLPANPYLGVADPTPES